jgi:WD40 repeat protein
MHLSSAWHAVAVLAMACSSASSTASAAPEAAPSSRAVGSGAPPAQASPPVAQRPRPSDADITPIAKTSAGGEVFAVGVPRFQLADPDGSGAVTLRARRGVVFAEDAKFIAVWDAASGAPLQRLAPKRDASPSVFVSLAVSIDGELLATGSSHSVRLYRAPFESPIAELACSTAHAFSHSGNLLACSTNVIGVWDLAKRQLVAPLPSSAPKGIVRALRFAPDDKSLVWATDRALFRWDFAGTGAVTPIYEPAARIEHAAIADGGSAAYALTSGKQAVVIDLATGKTSPAPPDYGAAISPTGRRLARATASLDVIDVATGKSVWNAKVASPVTRLAFGETDDAVAYVEAGHVRVATLPGAPTVPPSIARFAGWLGPGIAAFERGDVVRSFNLATRDVGTADRAALAPKPIAHAPPWARWLAEGGTDVALAAEPSKRHELPPDRRSIEPCNPKLRVWTPTGGTKALTFACTKKEIEGHEDPGWEIGGGWAVGVSATRATIFDVRTGGRVGEIDVPARKSSKPEFAPAYWQMALAPAGDWLALVWRRAVLEGANGTEPQDPREDAMHVAETAASVDCVSGEHGCQLEYFVELWSVKEKPKRVWQARLERSAPGRGISEPATPSGALAFDRRGTRLVLGFTDGEIRIVLTTSPETQRTEQLHVTTIRSVLLDPSGQWVFSGDGAGDQRLWRLAQ